MALPQSAEGAGVVEVAAHRHTVDTVIESLKIGRVHLIIVIAAGLGNAFDAFDTYIVSYAMPSIIRDWHIDPVTNGLLTSAGIWGMFAGALMWGPFSDKFGRKAGFIATILGFASLSGFTALAGNVYQFGLLRFVTGMCLGGMIPVDFCLTSEFINTKSRGRFVSVLTVLWPFGLLAAAIFSLVLVPHYGWRVLFVMGVLPAFLVLLIGWKMPESPRWLATKGRMEEAKAVLRRLGASKESVARLEPDHAEAEVPFRVLIQSKYLKRFILTAGYYFFGYFGYYGFVLWLPSILATIYHLSLVTTFTYTLYVAISAILGRVAAFYTIEKFGRKQLFYVGFGLGGVAALIFGTIKDPVVLVWGACVLSFLYEQAVTGTAVWTAELYPSKVRSTAISWSTSAGRLSSALSPVVFGWLVKNHMYYGVYISMAAFFWVAVALVYFLGVETKGRSLQHLGAA